jgi:hypothetical protein
MWYQTIFNKPHHPMHTIGENTYCCTLVGVGEFDEVEDVSVFALTPQPDWIVNNGEFMNDGKKWELTVGISHHDEEWRQENDIGDFLAECFQMLHKLTFCARAHFTIYLTYTSTRRDWISFTPETISTMGALRVGLEILMKNEPNHPLESRTGCDPV